MPISGSNAKGNEMQGGVFDVEVTNKCAAFCWGMIVLAEVPCERTLYKNEYRIFKLVETNIRKGVK
jgi:hypothetical protein